MIKVNLKGWADCINTKQSLVFPLSIAIYNSGYGHGWTITSESDVKDVRYPCSISFKATHISTAHYSEGKIKSFGKDIIELEYVSESYSLRSVYEGAMKALKNAKIKRVDEIVEET